MVGQGFGFFCHGRRYRAERVRKSVRARSTIRYDYLREVIVAVNDDVRSSRRRGGCMYTMLGEVIWRC